MLNIEQQSGYIVYSKTIIFILEGHSKNMGGPIISNMIDN